MTSKSSTGQAIAAASILWTSTVLAAWQIGWLSVESAFLATIPVQVSAGWLIRRWLVRILQTPYCELTIGAQIETPTPTPPNAPGQFPIQTSPKQANNPPLSLHSRHRRNGLIKVGPESEGTQQMELTVSGYAGKPPNIIRMLQREVGPLLKEFTKNNQGPEPALWLHIYIPNAQHHHHRNIIRQFGFHVPDDLKLQELNLQLVDKVEGHEVKVHIHKEGMHVSAPHATALI